METLGAWSEVGRLRVVLLHQPGIEHRRTLPFVMKANDPGATMSVGEFLDDHGLRRQELFRRVFQSLIELADGEERSLLESISNHVQSKGAAPEIPQMVLIPADATGNED